MDIFNGYKAYAAAILAAFISLNSVFHFVSPEIQAVILGIAAALGIAGVRHAIQKLEKKV